MIEELLARVYDNPDDDAARLVVADALQEKGDVRGEFIALQMHRHRTGAMPSAREQEIAREHAKELLGPLRDAVLVEQPYLFLAGLSMEPWVTPTGLFKRGFLARSVLYAGPSFADTVRAREWNTVEAVFTQYDADSICELVAQPSMKRVRYLAAPIKVVGAVCTSGIDRPVERIVLAMHGDVTVPEATRNAIAEGRCLPRLKELSLARLDGWMFRAPLMSRLETVCLQTASDTSLLREWIAAAASVGPGPRELRLYESRGSPFYDTSLTLTRGPDGRFSRLHASVPPGSDQARVDNAVTWLARLLDKQMDPDLPREIVIEKPMPASPATEQQLERALRRFRRAVRS